MKPNILLIIYYTSTSNSFITPNTNEGPGNQLFLCKGYEVFHKLHTKLNPCMNDHNLPLAWNYYIEKYHMGYQLEGVYNE